MILIGFSHQARTGKDTACDYLVKHHNFIKLSFAEALYEECRNLYITLRHPVPVGQIESYPPDVWGEDCSPGEWEYVGMTEKDSLLLQWWGTNVRRKQDPDYWVKRLANKVENIKALKDAENAFEEREHLKGPFHSNMPFLHEELRICISDCRFQNEADWITDQGGLVVRVSRPDRPIDRDPSHLSEVDLLNYPFDITVHNVGTLEEYLQKVELLYNQIKGIPVGTSLEDI
jgi:hypothetical protein